MFTYIITLFVDLFLTCSILEGQTATSMHRPFRIRYLFSCANQDLIWHIYQFTIRKDQHKLAMFWCKPQKEHVAKTEKNSRMDTSWSKKIQTQHSQRIQANQGYEGFNRIRGQFKRQLDQNNIKVKQYNQHLKVLQNISDVQRLPAPQFYFSSIKKYFSSPNLNEWQKDQNSNAMIEGIISIYHELVKSKKAEKQIITCSQFYLTLLQQVLTNEEVEKESYDALRQNGQILRTHNNSLLKKFEESIKSAKTVVIRQQQLNHKVEHGILAQLQDLKMHVKNLSSNSYPGAKFNEGLKRQDIIPQLSDIKILLQNGMKNSPSLPQKNKKKPYEQVNDYSCYQQEPPAYSQINRYWINQSARKDIHIDELQGMLKHVSERLEEAQLEIDRLQRQNRSGKGNKLEAQNVNKGEKPQRQSSISMLKLQIQKLRNEIREKEKYETELLQKSFENSQRVRLLQEVIERYRHMDEQNTKKLACMSKKINKAKHIQIRNVQLSHEITKLSSTIIGLEKTINQMKQKHENNHNGSSKIAAELQSERRKNKQLNQRIIEYAQKLDSLKQFFGQPKPKIFGGDLLDDRRQQKKFLLQSIQKQTGKLIKSTKFLYDFRRDNKVSFNPYIDGHANLVLIIKTTNALIGCYYSGVYEHRTPLEGIGIIMSLDNKKCYTMKSPRSQGMIYDFDYLIFGKDEISIEGGKQIVTSRFGLEDGDFNTKSDSINALFREGNSREVKIINYQIYDADFGDEKMEERKC